ncbi:MAG: DJ-1/PfpI family protein [Dysgonamonadaceae bacterium]|nr:DJ-1/PfpI family protein [Dysgonamonadaceae bacterium]MDD3901379.1 DJ-1/PfpI family protein [Dysgonamonadaceae bacterium]
MKVIVFLATGFEETEAIATVDVLRRAGFNVTTVSITGEYDVTSAHNVTIIADTLFEETDFSNIDILVLPGGMPGAKNLKEHEGVRKLLVDFSKDTKKHIGAICAAPMVLGDLGILNGKKATAYPGFENELKGATYTAEATTVDGRIITGKGPGFVFEFGLTLVEVLAGKEKREQVAKGLLFSK